MAVINKAEYLSLKYLAVIVKPAPQAIARNSKKFPKRGFGELIDVVPCKLNHIAPDIAIKEPNINCFVIISFKKYPAAIAVIIGIREVIIPACDALVNCKAFDSNIKYKHGSNKANKSINFISFFEKSYFKKDFIK